MVDFALELGRHHGVELEGVVAAGETLEIDEGTYDFVYAANTVHHVTDRAGLFSQFHRALKAGGIFFTWDPIAYNPIIKVYRLLATKVRTEDEAPLTAKDVVLARRQFFPQHAAPRVLDSDANVVCKVFPFGSRQPRKRALLETNLPGDSGRPALVDAALGN